MATYVFAYSSGGDMPDPKEAQAASMVAWGAWFGGPGASVVDAGSPATLLPFVRPLDAPIGGTITAIVRR